MAEINLFFRVIVCKSAKYVKESLFVEVAAIRRG